MGLELDPDSAQESLVAPNVSVLQRWGDSGKCPCQPSTPKHLVGLIDFILRREDRVDAMGRNESRAVKGNPRLLCDFRDQKLRSLPVGGSETIDGPIPRCAVAHDVSLFQFPPVPLEVTRQLRILPKVSKPTVAVENRHYVTTPPRYPSLLHFGTVYPRREQLRFDIRIHDPDDERRRHSQRRPHSYHAPSVDQRPATVVVPPSHYATVCLGALAFRCDEDVGVCGHVPLESPPRVDPFIVSYVQPRQPLATEAVSVGRVPPPVGANKPALAAAFELVERSIQERQVEISSRHLAGQSPFVHRPQTPRHLVPTHVRRVANNVGERLPASIAQQEITRAYPRFRARSRRALVDAHLHQPSDHANACAARRRRVDLERCDPRPKVTRPRLDALQPERFHQTPGCLHHELPVAGRWFQQPRLRQIACRPPADLVEYPAHQGRAGVDSASLMERVGRFAVGRFPVPAGVCRVVS